MFFGILLGVCAASMQSVSYVASRIFLVKHKSPFVLTLYSQLIMFFMCIVIFSIVLLHVNIPLSWEFVALSLSSALFFLGGQSGFFMAMRDIEASRSSALLGLKMVVLAIATTLLGDHHNIWQWLAVILCTVGAVGMNFSGGKMPLRGCMWMLVSLTCYALCDMACAAMVMRIEGDNIIVRSIAVVCLNYLNLGVLVLIVFTRVKFEARKFKDAIPFATLWVVASVGLISCYGLLGALYGNIIQSSRGLVSVLLGAIILKLGYEKLEPRVDRKAWIRRFVMAGVMVTAMILYACSMN